MNDVEGRVCSVLLHIARNPLKTYSGPKRKWPGSRRAIGRSPPRRRLRRSSFPIPGSIVFVGNDIHDAGIPQAPPAAEPLKIAEHHDRSVVPVRLDGAIIVPAVQDGRNGADAPVDPGAQGHCSMSRQSFRHADGSPAPAYRVRRYGSRGQFLAHFIASRPQERAHLVDADRVQYLPRNRLFRVVQDRTKTGFRRTRVFRIDP